MSALPEFEQSIDSLIKELKKLTFDPSSKVFYDLMSGGLVWSDERVSGLASNKQFCLRAIFHYRTSLIQGVPARKYETLWDILRTKYPEWIGFSPQRCLPCEELLAVLQRLKPKSDDLHTLFQRLDTIQ